MEENSQERIERYLIREMSDQEAVEFEKKLAVDPLLRQELEAYRLSIAALKLNQREQLRNRFQKLDKGHSGKKRLFKLLLFILLVVIWMIFLINLKDKSAESIEKNNLISDSVNIQSNPERIKDSTLSPKIIPQPEQKAKNHGSTIIIASKQEKIDTNTITMAVKPYRGEELNFKIRGVGDLTPYDLFMKFYWDSDYQKVLEQFDNLNPALQSNGNVLFLKANALIGLGKYDESSLIFKQVVNDKKSRYTAIAGNYLKDLKLITKAQKDPIVK